MSGLGSSSLELVRDYGIFSLNTKIFYFVKNLNPLRKFMGDNPYLVCFVSKSRAKDEFFFSQILAIVIFSTWVFLKPTNTHTFVLSLLLSHCAGFPDLLRSSTHCCGRSSKLDERDFGKLFKESSYI